MSKSIHHSETIVKMLTEINIAQQLSGIAITHIITIWIAIFRIGYGSQTADFENHGDCHRTAIGYFLTKGKWRAVIIENTISIKKRCPESHPLSRQRFCHLIMPSS